MNNDPPTQSLPFLDETPFFELTSEDNDDSYLDDEPNRRPKNGKQIKKFKPQHSR